ncbi:HAD-IIIA family hydrolase [Ornithinibacillus salinisoli]|uniref:D,D-heptose 1,7-bisphosphate phosphatase n=1 Tax=Ornithinibacillus salinisoli TaxID=1848459 RepID=A0ABW4VUY1_9BACI
MEKYEELLSEEEIHILEIMIGKRLQELYSTSLDSQLFIRNVYHFYQPIVLSFENHYVAIDIEYLETNDGTGEYYDLTLKEQNTPEPINYDTHSDNICLHPPLVSFGIWSKISGFSIFAEEELTEEDHIISDVAIILYLENNRRQCLSGRSNWSTLRVTWDDDWIDDILEGCYERYCVGSKGDIIQTVFIDRDGTIGGSDKVAYPGDFSLFPGVKDSIKDLKQAELKLFSFTNQPGISRGEVTSEALAEELIGFGIENVYLCPHEHDQGCSCRKPNTKMLTQAAREYGLALDRCVVIGDRWTDLLAAHRVGCKKILVKTGAGMESLKKYQHQEYYGEWKEVEPDYIATDFVDAVDWILKNK